MLLKRQQEKVTPFLQATLQNEPAEREKFEKEIDSEIDF